MTAHNTFDNPEAVKPAVFNDVQLKEDVLTVVLPAKSVVVLEIE
jgi:alpha-N-arabinofuranosidase